MRASFGGALAAWSSFTLPSVFAYGAEALSDKLVAVAAFRFVDASRLAVSGRAFLLSS
jgi:hypothetical protein